MLRAAAFAVAVIAMFTVVLVPVGASAQEAAQEAAPGGEPAAARARAVVASLQARIAASERQLEVLDARVVELEDALAAASADVATAKGALAEAVALREAAEARHAEAVAEAAAPAAADPPASGPAGSAPAGDTGAALRSAVAQGGPGHASDGLADLLHAVTASADSAEGAPASADSAGLTNLEAVRQELEAATARDVEAQRTLVEARTAELAVLTDRPYEIEIALAAAVADHDMATVSRSTLDAQLEAARGDMGAARNAAGAPGTGPYVWPTDGTPTSGFGPRIHPVYGSGRMHSGTDIPGDVGQPILAAAAGTVLEARAMSGYGLTVVLEHEDGTRTLYAHMSELAVAQGQPVEQSDRIGSLGNTGVSTGPHLHFEVHEDGGPVDPMQWFD